MPKLSHYAIIASRQQSCKNTDSNNLDRDQLFVRPECHVQGDFIVNQVGITKTGQMIQVDGDHGVVRILQ